MCHMLGAHLGRRVAAGLRLAHVVVLRNAIPNNRCFIGEWAAILFQRAIGRVVQALRRWHLVHTLRSHVRLLVVGHHNDGGWWSPVVRGTASARSWRGIASDSAAGS